MDKNSIIGIILIAAVLIGFNIWMRPSEEEIAAQKRYNDSIAQVRADSVAEMLRLEQALADQSNDETAVSDSLRALTYGSFASAAVGTDEVLQIENDKLRLGIGTKGGMIRSAELKEFVTGDSLPLFLFDGEEENHLFFTLLTADNRVLSTDNLYFTAQPLVTNDSALIYTLRSSISDDSYIDFIYTIPHDDYMLRFSVQTQGMVDYLDPRTAELKMSWVGKIRQQEKGRKFEERYATLNFRFLNDDVEQLKENKDALKDESTPIQWIAFKDQFFSTIIIPEEHFDNGAKMESWVMGPASGYMKKYEVETSVPFDIRDNKPSNFKIYMGPNQYKVLKSYDKTLSANEEMHLEHLVPLGWKAFRWVSKWIVIPMFNFFGRFINNYGIIILLMTLVIKLILLPFTFKSYMSTAKMRVLKPQIDAINARIPAEKAMERQQETMALYRRAGVSPMGGCLPMLVQMPLLVAMFQFFPTAFELRQESFLWAHDLSSYDAILEWGFNIPLLGNHLSLFCLLMTITNIIYTKITMASQGSNEQMAMMKWMMYLMPVMFFFMFNDYASGLSYYYFVSLLLTIIQTMLFRLSINDEKLLAKLEANKNKPVKKSGFMAKLEAAQKEQERRIREQSQQRSKRK